MFKPILLSAALLLAAPSLFLISLAPPLSADPIFPPAQEPVPASAPYVIPPEAAARTNPLKQLSPEGLSHAKRMYGYDCATCHGANGDGRGEIAVLQKLPMNDLTNPAILQKYTDGELFYMIKTGKNQMPAEGDRLNDQGYWNMVLYVRSLAKK